MSDPPQEFKPQILASAGAEPLSLSSFGDALAWLLQPVRKKTFFEEYWEKRPLVIHRAQPDYFTAIFSLQEADRVLTTLDRRYPDVILKNAIRPVSEDEYTLNSDSLDVAKVYQLFSEGSTITLAYLDTVVPALTLFCRGLEREFSCPFQTNIYLTPPAAQGAKPHYDTHDVLVLQVEGSKKWTIFGTPVELPLRGQDFDPALHPLGAPTLEFELAAGDAAYIPRGVAHEARSTDSVSLHITAGILRYTWAELLLEFVAGACLNDAAFRKALPPGFAREGFDRELAQKTLHGLLQRAASTSGFDHALDHFVGDFMASCPPPLQGQMAQMAAIDGLAMDSLVSPRPGAIYRLSGDGGAAVDCRGERITFPARAGETLRFALSTPRFAVRDLPGSLDDAGKLTLVRRLIREGLLMAALP